MLCRFTTSDDDETMKQYAEWGIWLAATMVLTTYLFMTLRSEDKSVFLVGLTTSGHHQIELACESCHTSAFGGAGLLQKACEGCHLEELRAVRDSHPQRKFTDPANADRVAVLDARFCVTCHREHQEDITRSMGVTVPDDVCFLCHEKIGEERASHAGLSFTSCASSGCHNFHDNTALYEDFLFANNDSEWLHATAAVPSLSAVEAAVQSLMNNGSGRLLLAQVQAPAAAMHDTALLAQWQESAHALTNIACADCHNTESTWQDQPGLEVCQSCHATQAGGFLAGKHGMRVAAGLSPMTVQQARIPMHENAAHLELGCTSCHGAHNSDIKFAAVDACQSCHASEHTQSYSGSPHDQLRLRSLAGDLPETEAVTCATCHLPRSTTLSAGVQVTHTEHNQNANLRPSDKMLRSVCMNCHSLEFSIDALADQALIDNNFKGRPAQHVESIDMVLQRRKSAGDSAYR